MVIVFALPVRQEGIGKMRVAAKLVVLFAGLASAVAGHAQNCSGMSLGKNASLNGFVPFPSSNLWNTDVSAAPVDPNSAAITSASGFAGLHLHFDFSSQDIYGIPYVVVDSTTTPSVPINVIDYASESDVVVAPYPANAPIEGKPADCTGWPDTYQGDAHVLVLDRATCELYETFNTNRCNGQWNASSETIWNMKTGAARPWGWTSADAAGLPIFAGLVRYDEVAAGAIHHAIRFTMQHTKNDANDGYFVPPATHAAGTTWGVSNVMGMRIRLKAGFDISGFSAANQVILTAMKHYGMILADNGGYFFFQGAPDPRWDDNDLENLNAVGSENFEVVQMTPEFPGYDSATAPTGPAPVINSFTASASTVSSGKPVTLSYSVSGDSYDYIDVYALLNQCLRSNRQCAAYRHGARLGGHAAGLHSAFRHVCSAAAGDDQHAHVHGRNHPLHHQRERAHDQLGGVLRDEPGHGNGPGYAEGDCGCARIRRAQCSGIGSL